VGSSSENPASRLSASEESPFSKARAQPLEKRVLRWYKRRVVPTKTGLLYVISKRMLLLADGVTSFPLRKVLDVDVDPDAKQVTITQDRRQRPVILAVADAIVTGAMKSGAKWCPATFCAHMKMFANNRDSEGRDYYLNSRFPLTRQEEGDRVCQARIHGWPPMGSPSQGTLGHRKAQLPFFGSTSSERRRSSWPADQDR
jgi:hypothetical protein